MASTIRGSTQENGAEVRNFGPPAYGRDTSKEKSLYAIGNPVVIMSPMVGNESLDITECERIKVGTDYSLR